MRHLQNFTRRRAYDDARFCNDMCVGSIQCTMPCKLSVYHFKLVKLRNDLLVYNRAEDERVWIIDHLASPSSLSVLDITSGPDVYISEFIVWIWRGDFETYSQEQEQLARYVDYDHHFWWGCYMYMYSVWRTDKILSRIGQQVSCWHTTRSNPPGTHAVL